MPCTRMTSLGEPGSRQTDSRVVGHSMVLVTPSISRTVAGSPGSRRNPRDPARSAASHPRSVPSCSTAAVAASPASFHPSKAAIITGLRSSGTPHSIAGQPTSGRRGSARRAPGHGRRSPAGARHYRLPDAAATPQRPPVATAWRRGGTSTRRLAANYPVSRPTSVSTHCWPRSTERVLVADGAMGTMLQAQDPSLDDFAGPRGLQRDPQRDPAGHRPGGAPRLPRGRRRRHRDEHFGANLANLAEYDIPDRIYELARAGAALARAEADEFATPDQPRFVLGSVGPGTKLPTLGHAAVRRRCGTPTSSRSPACWTAASTR